MAGTEVEIAEASRRQASIKASLSLEILNASTWRSNSPVAFSTSGLSDVTVAAVRGPLIVEAGSGSVRFGVVGLR